MAEINRKSIVHGKAHMNESKHIKLIIL